VTRPYRRSRRRRGACFRTRRSAPTLRHLRPTTNTYERASLVATFPSAHPRSPRALSRGTPSLRVNGAAAIGLSSERGRWRHSLPFGTHFCPRPQHARQPSESLDPRERSRPSAAVAQTAIEPSRCAVARDAARTVRGYLPLPSRVRYPLASGSARSRRGCRCSRWRSILRSRGTRWGQRLPSVGAALTRVNESVSHDYL